MKSATQILYEAYPEEMQKAKNDLGNLSKRLSCDEGFAQEVLRIVMQRLKIGGNDGK